MQTRREFVKLAGTAALSAALAGKGGVMAEVKARDMLVYIGTYTGGKSEGIYLYRLSAADGTLAPAGKPAGTQNPSFLAIHPAGRFLYCVNELGQFAGKPGGGVTAFAIAAGSGELTLLNQQPSGGGAPCHLTVDKTGRFVLAANYSGGNASVFPIQADGRLGEAVDFVQHHGTGPNVKRQEHAHAHSVNLDPANRHALICDLGMDKVMIYRFDEQTGKLSPADPPFAATKPGAGPRHLAFHPNRKLAYLINELDNTIIAFAYDEATGRLSEVQTVPTLPAGWSGTSTCAEVQVAPSGKFVYGSNRGHDSIVCFAIDQATGRLTYVAHEPTQGKNPRNFALDPSGSFLLAANQDGNNVVVFRVDSQAGRLKPTGQVLEIPSPVCVKMMPAP